MAAAKEHRVVNQDPPIHPQFSITPRYSNTQLLTILDPGERGTEQGTYTSIYKQAELAI